MKQSKVNYYCYSIVLIIVLSHFSFIFCQNENVENEGDSSSVTKRDINKSLVEKYSDPDEENGFKKEFQGIEKKLFKFIEDKKKQVVSNQKLKNYTKKIKDIQKYLEEKFADSEELIKEFHKTHCKTMSGKIFGNLREQMIQILMHHHDRKTSTKIADALLHLLHDEENKKIICQSWDTNSQSPELRSLIHTKEEHEETKEQQSYTTPTSKTIEAEPTTEITVPTTSIVKKSGRKDRFLLEDFTTQKIINKTTKTSISTESSEENVPNTNIVDPNLHLVGKDIKVPLKIHKGLNGMLRLLVDYKRICEERSSDHDPNLQFRRADYPSHQESDEAQEEISSNFSNSSEESRLNHPNRSNLSYPNGMFDNKIDNQQGSSGYLSGLSDLNRLNGSSDQPGYLNRSDDQKYQEINSSSDHNRHHPRVQTSGYSSRSNSPSGYPNNAQKDHQQPHLPSGYYKNEPSGYQSKEPSDYSSRSPDDIQNNHQAYTSSGYYQSEPRKSSSGYLTLLDEQIHNQKANTAAYPPSSGRTPSGYQTDENFYTTNEPSDYRSTQNKLFVPKDYSRRNLPSGYQNRPSSGSENEENTTYPPSDYTNTPQNKQMSDYPNRFTDNQQIHNQRRQNSASDYSSRPIHQERPYKKTYISFDAPRRRQNLPPDYQSRPSDNKLHPESSSGYGNPDESLFTTNEPSVYTSMPLQNKNMHHQQILDTSGHKQPSDYQSRAPGKIFDNKYHTSTSPLGYTTNGPSESIKIQENSSSDYPSRSSDHQQIHHHHYNTPSDYSKRPNLPSGYQSRPQSSSSGYENPDVYVTNESSDYIMSPQNKLIHHQIISPSTISYQSLSDEDMTPDEFLPSDYSNNNPNIKKIIKYLSHKNLKLDELKLMLEVTKRVDDKNERDKVVKDLIINLIKKKIEKLHQNSVQQRVLQVYNGDKSDYSEEEEVSLQNPIKKIFHDAKVLKDELMKEINNKKNKLTMKEIMERVKILLIKLINDRVEIDPDVEQKLEDLVQRIVRLKDEGVQIPSNILALVDGLQKKFSNKTENILNPKIAQSIYDGLQSENGFDNGSISHLTENDIDNINHILTLNELIKKASSLLNDLENQKIAITKIVYNKIVDFIKQAIGLQIEIKDLDLSVLIKRLRSMIPKFITNAWQKAKNALKNKLEPMESNSKNEESELIGKRINLNDRKQQNDRNDKNDDENEDRNNESNSANGRRPNIFYKHKTAHSKAIEPEFIKSIESDDDYENVNKDQSNYYRGKWGPNDSAQRRTNSFNADGNFDSGEEKIFGGNLEGSSEAFIWKKNDFKTKLIEKPSEESGYEERKLFKNHRDDNGKQYFHSHYKAPLKRFETATNEDHNDKRRLIDHKQISFDDQLSYLSTIPDPENEVAGRLLLPNGYSGGPLFTSDEIPENSNSDLMPSSSNLHETKDENVIIKWFTKNPKGGPPIVHIIPYGKIVWYQKR